MHRHILKHVLKFRIASFTLIEMLLTLFITFTLCMLLPLFIQNANYYFHQATNAFDVEYELFAISLHQNKVFQHATFEVKTPQKILIKKNHELLWLKYQSHKIILEYPHKGNIILLNDVQSASFTIVNHQFIKIHLQSGGVMNIYEKNLYLSQ